MALGGGEEGHEEVRISAIFRDFFFEKSQSKFFHHFLEDALGDTIIIAPIKRGKSIAGAPCAHNFEQNIKTYTRTQSY